MLAEWAAPGIPPLGDASRLPAVNLAARERRTVAVGDVLQAPELDDPTLGDVGELTDRSVRAVLATPIVAFDRVIGVLGLHRAEPGSWTRSEISLAEAVALEAAIAIDTSRLLRESDRRLAEQQALLKAGEALTSDLRVDVVIDRLVDEMRSLVNGDAADCWTFAPEGASCVPRGRRATRVGGRPPDPRGRHGRRGDHHRQAGPPPQLRRDRAAATDGELRDLRRGDGRADPLVRGDARRPRRLLARAGPLRRVGPSADRGLREPGVGGAAQRRGVRGEHAPDAGRARLLPDRVGAERAVVCRSDARRGRPGGGGGARRRVGRRAPLRRRRPGARRRPQSRPRSRRPICGRRPAP